MLRVFALLTLVVACRETRQQSASQASGEPAESFVTVNDAKLFVRSVGGSPTSPTLVVVHGGWGLSHEYLRGLDALASPSLRIVYYDQRGVGHSTGVIGQDAFARNIDDLEAVRADLHIEHMIVLGHSAGGLTALAYAIAHPEHVAKLLLIDGIAPTRKEWEAGRQRLNTRIGELADKGVIAPARNGDSTAFLQSILPVYFVNTSHPGSKSLGGATFKLDVGRATDSSLGDFDFTAKTATLTMPVFVYAAEVPFGNMGSVVLESLPADKATRLIVSDCGHLPWIECPERFVPAIRSFVQ